MSLSASGKRAATEAKARRSNSSVLSGKVTSTLPTWQMVSRSRGGVLVITRRFQQVAFRESLSDYQCAKVAGLLIQPFADCLIG